MSKDHAVLESEARTPIVAPKAKTNGQEQSAEAAQFVTAEALQREIAALRNDARELDVRLLGKRRDREMVLAAVDAELNKINSAIQQNAGAQIKLNDMLRILLQPGGRPTVQQ